MNLSLQQAAEVTGGSTGGKVDTTPTQVKQSDTTKASGDHNGPGPKGP